MVGNKWNILEGKSQKQLRQLFTPEVCIKDLETLQRIQEKEARDKDEEVVRGMLGSMTTPVK